MRGGTLLLFSLMSRTLTPQPDAGLRSGMRLYGVRARSPHSNPPVVSCSVMLTRRVVPLSSRSLAVSYGLDRAVVAIVK